MAQLVTKLRRRLKCLIDRHDWLTGRSGVAVRWCARCRRQERRIFYGTRVMWVTDRRRSR